MENFIFALCVFLSAHSVTRGLQQFSSVRVAIPLQSANIFSFLDLFLNFVFTGPTAAWNFPIYRSQHHHLYNLPLISRTLNACKDQNIFLIN